MVIFDASTVVDDWVYYHNRLIPEVFSEHADLAGTLDSCIDYMEKHIERI